MNAALEGLVQPCDEVEVHIVVELHGLQIRFANILDDLVRVRCGKDANGEQSAGKMRSDLGDLCRIHAPPAGREDEADCVCTQLSSELRIRKVRVGTDLNEHAWSGPSIEQVLQCFTRLRLLHQRFADEKRFIASVAQALHVFTRVNATLGDVHSVARKLRGELAGAIKRNLEGAKVAAVYAHALALQWQGSFQLGSVMYLAEHIQVPTPCFFAERAQFRVSQRCHDQQDGVGSVGAGLDDLKRINHEVFAQTRDCGRGRRFTEIVERTLKEFFIGEDGKNCSACVLHLGRQSRGIEG